jgi:DNA relaxase NicK
MINLKVLEVMTSEERMTYIVEKLNTQGEHRLKVSLKQATRWRNFVDCSLNWSETSVGSKYFEDLNSKVMMACPELDFY